MDGQAGTSYRKKSDFPDEYAYATYIKRNVKTGMTVRYCGHGRGIKHGDTGTVAILDNHPRIDRTYVRWSQSGPIWTMNKNLEII